MRSGKYAVLFLAMVLVCAFVGGAIASEYGAVMDGPWGSAATWTPSGGPPAGTDTAWIGSTQPFGSAAVSTVTLDANQSVYDLNLGNGVGTAGELDLAGFDLDAVGTIRLGSNGSTGSISGQGAVRASTLIVEGQNSYTFRPQDALNTLHLEDGGQAATAATGNVTAYAWVIGSDSRLVLGDSLDVTQEVRIGGGSSSEPAVLDVNGHDITAPLLRIGYQGAGELINDAAITAGELDVYDRPFAFDADDQATFVVAYNAAIELHPTTQIFSMQLHGTSSTIVHLTNSLQYLSLNNSQNTTLVATNNVTTKLSMSGPSTQLTLMAGLDLVTDVVIGSGAPGSPAVLDANGHSITARSLYLDDLSSSALVDDGALQIGLLQVGNGAFELDGDDVATDIVANNTELTLHPSTQGSSLTLAGSSSTQLFASNQFQFLTLSNGQETFLVATNNVTSGVSISGPSTQLTLMTDLNLSIDVAVGGGAPGSPAVLDANGHSITARNLYLDDLSSSALVDDGALQVGLLRVGNGAFELDGNDVATYIVANNTELTLHPATHATSLELTGSSSTQLFASNQFQNLTLSNGQETVMVATSNVTHIVDVYGPNTQLTLAADVVLSGGLFVRAGTPTEPAVLAANGFDLTAHQLWISGGEIRDEGFVTVTNTLQVSSNASLRGGFDEVDGVIQVLNNATFRVTQEEDHARGLSLDGGTLEVTGQGVLQLEFDAVQDPFGEWTFRWAGDRVAAIESMLSSGRIVVQSPHSFSVVNNGDGYTYIARFQVDFNQDGRSNCDDLAVLGAAIVAGSMDLQFDLTGDGQVTTADRNAWLEGAGRIFLRSGNSYLPGDANLDGVVDGSDFGVWNAHKFTTTSSWCEGDFNTDGVVDGSDFGIWNAHKFTSSNSLRAVPEPTGAAAVVTLILVAWLRRGGCRTNCFTTYR